MVEGPGGMSWTGKVWPDSVPKPTDLLEQEDDAPSSG